MRHVLFASLLAFCTVQAASANNNLFLPGDAFFPVELTADSLKSLEVDSDEKRAFDYSSFGAYDGAFCGYAGYSRAQIPSVDGPFIGNLQAAYNEIRKFENKELVEVVINGRKQLRETNGARALIYPESFDFPRFKIGLQYNEGWVEEAVKFGHDIDHLRLCEFVKRRDAVVESWRDSKRVGSFSITLPKVELTPLKRVDEPVIIKDRVKAIVVPARQSFDELFRPTELQADPIFVVTSKSVVRWDYRDKQWRVAEPK
jgi:hypothetical protein